MLLGRPQTAYRSPPQRNLCEVLRARRPLGATTLGVSVCAGERLGLVPSLLLQPLRRSPAVLRGDESPLRVCELLVQARARGWGHAGAAISSGAGLGCWLCWP